MLWIVLLVATIYGDEREFLFYMCSSLVHVDIFLDVKFSFSMSLTPRKSFFLIENISVVGEFFRCFPEESPSISSD